jgi:sugar-phosphatase
MGLPPPVRHPAREASLSAAVWSCRALLFDLDGVLVDSRRVVERVWHRWAHAHGFDPAAFLAIAHGRRTSETLRLVAPDLDWRAEVAALDRMEETDTEGLVAEPAAAALLDGLPPSAWAIVTSGSRAVARLRLTAARLRLPRILVTGDDVEHGKPDPEGYRLAAARLDVPPGDCVVVEDAPPGIAAAKAAGMRVLAVLTTHHAHHLAGADACITGLGALGVAFRDGALRLALETVAGPHEGRHTPQP